MKYIWEFLPPYCLYGLFEIEPMFQFYEDTGRAEEFDDEETKRLKMRSREKGKSEEDQKLWRYKILQMGISKWDMFPETFLVLNFVQVMIHQDLIHIIEKGVYESFV